MFAGIGGEGVAELRCAFSRLTGEKERAKPISPAAALRPTLRTIKPSVEWGIQICIEDSERRRYFLPRLAICDSVTDSISFSMAWSTERNVSFSEPATRLWLASFTEEL